MSEHPLSEATFCILLSLASQERHGYAILQDVRALSRGRVVLSTSTLYSALKRLLELMWIERIETLESKTKGSREQKVYRITERGRSILQAEQARMESLVRVAQERVTQGGKV